MAGLQFRRLAGRVLGEVGDPYVSSFHYSMLNGARAASGGPPVKWSWHLFVLYLLGVGSPWAIASDPNWSSIGPFGGGSQVVAIDPTQPSRIYTLTSNSFLYRSEDEGMTWRLIRFPAQQAASAQALVINPTNSKEIWIGVSSGNPAIQGIYRTSNSGASWHHLAGLKGESVFSLALFAKDTRIVAAGARDGVHLSRDGGESWARISPLENKELQPVMSLGFDPNRESTLYAGTPHLPWKTEDSGKSWRSIHKGMIDDSDILALIINPKKPAQLFIGACSGIYRSDNSATLWTKLLGITGAGYRTYAVAQDPSNPNIVFSGTRDGLWKSSDGGKTWHKTSPHIVKSIAISPIDSKKVYLATQDAGMLRSVDGGETITAGVDGFADHRLNQIAADRHSIYVTGAQEHEAWRMLNGHKPWTKVQLPVALQGQRITLSGAGSTLYALGGGAMYRSVDQGKAWARLVSPATSLAVLSENELVAATGRTLAHSLDGGVTWKPLSAPKESVVRLFATAGQPHFVAESNTGFQYYHDASSVPVKMAIPVRPSEVNDLVFAGNALIAATSRGVCRSADKGATWHFVTKGIDAGTVASVASSGTAALFAAQYGKVYRSQDSGESWSEMTTEGLDETSILRLAVTPAGRLMALTPSRGVFVLEGSHHMEAAAEPSGARDK